MTSSHETEATPSASAPEHPCSSPEAHQFDFWVGEWDLTWGESERGSNKITKTLGNCVILEEFNGTPAMEFHGLSVSVFNQRTNLWHQTWVDSSGGYLDFKGSYQDGRMIMNREAIIEGRPVTQRMVWYNLAEDSLDWNWERSFDGGETWEVVWHIRYRRKS